MICRRIFDDIDAAAISPAGLARLAAIDPASLPAIYGAPRFGPCVAQVPKFIGVGLNYSDHAAEANMPVPTEPILFQKATSCIVGANDDVMLPQGSRKLDWEVELGIVIGSRARYVEESAALDCVAGYCVVNDVSEREYPARAARPVDQGQGLRHVRPDRPVAGHQGRDRRRRQISACSAMSTASGARPAAPRRWCSSRPSWSAISAAS